jgi:hypothetical protein
MRILSKGAKTEVRIGFTTHNGAESTVARAATRELARQVCNYVNAQKNMTCKQRAALAAQLCRN